MIANSNFLEAEIRLDLIDEYKGYQIYKKNQLEPADGDRTKIFFRVHKGKEINRFFVILPNTYLSWLKGDIEKHLGDLGLRVIKLKIKNLDFSKNICIRPDINSNGEYVDPDEVKRLLDKELDG